MYGDSWRVGISIYGWFPGTHGTVGVLGHDASANASFSDVFHTLKGLIPLAVEADKGRFVMPIDFLWMKLGYDKHLNQRSLDAVNLYAETRLPRGGRGAPEGRCARRNPLLVSLTGHQPGTFGGELLKVSQLG